MDQQLFIPWATTEDNGSIVYKAIYKNYTIVFNMRDNTVVLRAKNTDEDPIIFLNDRYNNKLVAVFECTNDDETIRTFIRVKIHQHTRLSNIHAQGPLFEIAELDKPQI